MSIQALQQQRLLLKMEYQAEKEAFRKQTEAMGIGRKIKRGDAWYPLRVGKGFYNSLNQFAIEVFRTTDQDTEHNFEFGKPVMFFSLSQKGARKAVGTRSNQTKDNDKPATGQGVDGREGEVRYLNFTGTVSYVDGDRMVIIVPEGHALDIQSSETPMGVQLSFDETSYQTMFDALARVIAAKGNRMAYLRNLFYSTTPAERFSFEPIRFPWLNASQEKAVNEILQAKDVAIVHGPPGTGKTTTLV